MMISSDFRVCLSIRSLSCSLMGRVWSPQLFSWQDGCTKNEHLCQNTRFWSIWGGKILWQLCQKLAWLRSLDYRSPLLVCSFLSQLRLKILLCACSPRICSRFCWHVVWIKELLDSNDRPQEHDHSKLLCSDKNKTFLQHFVSFS